MCLVACRAAGVERCSWYIGNRTLYGFVFWFLLRACLFERSGGKKRFENWATTPRNPARVAVLQRVIIYSESTYCMYRCIFVIGYSLAEALLISMYYCNAFGIHVRIPTEKTRNTISSSVYYGGTYS